MACLSQQQSITGSQTSKSTHVISQTQTAVWLKPPHQIYQHFPSWRSQLQSRNNHVSAHVSVMETQPVSPLKIEHQTTLSSPSATVLWFGLRAVHWSHLGEITGFVLVRNQNRYISNCVKSLNMCCVDDASKCLKLLPVILFILWNFSNFYLMKGKKKKWIIKLWPVLTWEKDRLSTINSLKNSSLTWNY